MKKWRWFFVILDLVSMDMYVSYNVKLAHKLGLQAAVYITELLNINRKALQKEKMVNEKFFKVQREYIKERTTLTPVEQKQIDKMLEEIKILEIGETKDILCINTDVLTGLLLDNSKIVDKILEPVRRRKTTKAEAILNNLKNRITTTNEELKTAYEMWIESVIARQGWMSSASVVAGQQAIDDYTHRDLDMALKILSIASTNGYRDIDWAIREFEKKERSNYRYSSTSPTFTKPKVSLDDNEVF